ncbi:MAG TPA: hypothetical protein PLY87_17040 [Planctomycetaceae bacterium]|nr:hypothetical protein [Planctomycetaceae bacterium]
MSTRTCSAFASGIVLFAMGIGVVAGLKDATKSDEYKIKFPMLLDSAEALRKLTGATHTPEAFVFDRTGNQLYRGLIDDSTERLGKSSPVKKHYLANALHAAVNGHALAIGHTSAVGCLLESLGSNAVDGDITFNREIAPIIFSNCLTCHRDGEVAPFSLSNYEQVSKRARQIAEVVSSHIMPPWKPAPGYGHFVGERRLSDGQIAILTKWANAGAPQGVSEDLPPLPRFPTGWQLGRPDLIIRMPRPFALYAEGIDVTQHFVVPLGLREDRLISAVEVHPGNPKIVHHAHMFMDTSGQARLLDAADPGEGYTRFGGHGLTSATYLGGWNPGATPHFFPAGTGRLMPKGGDVVFQIHYHPSGKPEFDQTEIGVYFAPASARQVIADLVVGSVDLLIPAGNANAQFTAEYTLPTNVTLMEIRPHMHLLGKSYQVRALLPTGSEVPLINIDEWDFNWQDSYVFAQAIPLPAGSKIQVLVTYDNSNENSNNPNTPPRTVFFGEESTDEMSNCAIRVTTDTMNELRTLMSDNGSYWSTQMDRYLSWIAT